MNKQGQSPAGRALPWDPANPVQSHAPHLVLRPPEMIPESRNKSYPKPGQVGPETKQKRV